MSMPSATLSAITHMTGWEKRVFHLTDRTGRLLGVFPSIEAAKAACPDAQEWRSDESRELGWNGWIDTIAFSDPDYKITLVSSNPGGFVRPADDMQSAVVVKSPFAAE